MRRVPGVGGWVKQMPVVADPRNPLGMMRRCDGSSAFYIHISLILLSPYSSTAYPMLDHRSPIYSAPDSHWAPDLHPAPDFALPVLATDLI